MATPKPKLYTRPEYLALERAAETKSEYADGVILAMTGGTRAHSLIIGNIVRRLGNQLDGRPCEVHPNDLRVRIEAENRYVYPDVVVVCGEPDLEDDHQDTLLNPTLVVEVLSPSSEAYDRGRKFGAYRTIPSLRDYLLVAQDEPRAERFSRSDGGLWTLRETVGLDGAVELPAIDCVLPMREIYDRVAFG
jgi:Uma2 family endonuclease